MTAHQMTLKMLDERDAEIDKLKQINTDLLKACDHVLSIVRLQPPPKLGGWNWPQIAEDLEAVIAKSKVKK